MERLSDETRLFGINNEPPTVVQAYAKFGLAVCGDVFSIPATVWFSLHWMFHMVMAASR